ncbi:histidinol-phosphate aminotransferase family protein [Sesbania bispinosa]|nr:histidinol-phosphate aminotransferase family protein [Sesbania bispinosa]
MIFAQGEIRQRLLSYSRWSEKLLIQAKTRATVFLKLISELGAVSKHTKTPKPLFSWRFRVSILRGGRTNGEDLHDPRLYGIILEVSVIHPLTIILYETLFHDPYAFYLFYPYACSHHRAESVALSLFEMMKNSSMVLQSVVLRWHKSFFLSVNPREGRTLSSVLVMVGG